MRRNPLIPAATLLLILAFGVPFPAAAQGPDLFDKFKSISGDGQLPEQPVNEQIWHDGRFSGYTNYWQTTAWQWRQHGNLFLIGQPDIGWPSARTQPTSRRNLASRASASIMAFSMPGSSQILSSLRTPTRKNSAGLWTAATSWPGSSRPTSSARPC